MSKDTESSNPLHWAAGYRDKRLLSADAIQPLAEVERAYIEMVLTFCRGNVPMAAKLLEVSPSTIYRKQSRWQAGG